MMCFVDTLEGVAGLILHSTQVSDGVVSSPQVSPGGRRQREPGEPERQGPQPWSRQVVPQHHTQNQLPLNAARRHRALFPPLSFICVEMLAGVVCAAHNSSIARKKSDGTALKAIRLERLRVFTSGHCEVTVTTQRRLLLLMLHITH